MNSKPRQLYFDYGDRSQDTEPAGSADGSAVDAFLDPTSKSRRRPVERPASSDRAIGLLESSAAMENLQAALRKVASNKGAPGPDRQSVEEVVARSAMILPKLAKALRDGSYQPGDIRRCWIPKGSGGRRGLGIPNVVDRIVQEAVRRPRNAGRSLDSVIARVNSYFQGWLGFFGPCTEEVLRTLGNIDAHARRRLRMLFVCRYRCPRHLFRALLRRGVPRGGSGKALASRRGPWRKSHVWAVNRAFPNAYFADKGLVSLRSSWHEHPVRSNHGPATAG